MNAKTDPAGQLDGQEEIPGTDLAVPPPAELTLAETMMGILKGHAIDTIAWAKAIVGQEEFDPGSGADAGLEMIARILLAETPDQALASADMNRLNDLLPELPGSHSPVIRITDAFPLPSDYNEGPKSFAVVSAFVPASGELVKFSIGAAQPQAVLCALVHNGWLPADIVMTRRLKPTKAGFYPINFEAGG